MYATISKSFTFDAAHRLEMLPADHKCHRLHGHTYKVELVLYGPVDAMGFVIDYAVLADWWAGLHEQLDHRYLNEVPGLDLPTTEHLAAWIAIRLLGNIASYYEDDGKTVTGVGLVLQRVRVFESSTTWCDVHPSEIDLEMRGRLGLT